MQENHGRKPWIQRTMGEQVSDTAGLSVCQCRSVWNVLSGLKQQWWTPINCPQARGGCACPPNPVRAQCGFCQPWSFRSCNKRFTMRFPMSRVAKEKPADKVPLQNQCLVSCLHSYPSCYYKMFFRFLDVSNCDTTVTHVSMSSVALHWKENPPLTAAQLHKVRFTDPKRTWTRSKQHQYGHSSRLAVRELAVQLLDSKPRRLWAWNAV